MNIEDAVVIITGAAGGIGRALAMELARREAGGITLVDRRPSVRDVAEAVNELAGDWVCFAFQGDVTDADFRSRVYKETDDRCGRVNICVPAAVLTQDNPATAVDEVRGEAAVYPIEWFRRVVEVNLIAPIYWALEMVAGIAESRAQEGFTGWEASGVLRGMVVFIGADAAAATQSQVAYAAAQAALEKAASTLVPEAILHGIWCGVIHPRCGDTSGAPAPGRVVTRARQNKIPGARAIGMHRPQEIAEAICAMISNTSLSGSLRVDTASHRLA